MDETWLAAAGCGLAMAGLKYFWPVYGTFAPTHYVWSRGLALLCDRNGGRHFVKRQRGNRPALRFDPATYTDICANELVWVRHIALPQFVAEVLPSIRHPFALVTGDEDWGIPSSFAAAQELLDNPYLAHWFTQNFDGTDTSGRISGIPIGIDFHTLSNRRKWGHWPATPAVQEKQLSDLVKHMPPTPDRLLLVHADFHLNKDKKQEWGDTRPHVEEILKQNVSVVFQRKKVPRRKLWQEKTKYAFVVSPHGNGLDCHRTWESLVLGNIVIVRKSSLDPLYEGLPVVIVDDWEEINVENLRRWCDQYNEDFIRPEVQERLTNAYWIDHMRQVLKNSNK